MTDEPASPLIGVVGPCTAGKSTLKQALIARGYRVRAIAQEHSGVKDMWRRLTKPDLLIYLDVSIEQARQRRSISWGQDRLDTQGIALAHARDHADLYINTDTYTPGEVLAQVLAFIHGLGYADPLPPGGDSG